MSKIKLLKNVLDQLNSSCSSLTKAADEIYKSFPRKDLIFIFTNSSALKLIRGFISANNEGTGIEESIIEIYNGINDSESEDLSNHDMYMMKFLHEIGMRFPERFLKLLPLLIESSKKSSALYQLLRINISKTFKISQDDYQRAVCNMQVMSINLKNALVLFYDTHSQNQGYLFFPSKELPKCINRKSKRKGLENNADNFPLPTELRAESSQTSIFSSSDEGIDPFLDKERNDANQDLSLNSSILNLTGELKELRSSLARSENQNRKLQEEVDRLQVCKPIHLDDHEDISDIKMQLSKLYDDNKKLNNMIKKLESDKRQVIKERDDIEQRNRDIISDFDAERERIIKQKNAEFKKQEEKYVSLIKDLRSKIHRMDSSIPYDKDEFDIIQDQSGEIKRLNIAVESMTEQYENIKKNYEELCNATPENIKESLMLIKQEKDKLESEKNELKEMSEQIEREREDILRDKAEIHKRNAELSELSKMAAANIKKENVVFKPEVILSFKYNVLASIKPFDKVKEPKKNSLPQVQPETIPFKVYTFDDNPDLDERDPSMPVEYDPPSRRSLVNGLVELIKHVIIPQ